MFQLRFPTSEIAHWAGGYDTAYDTAVATTAAAVRARGWLTYDDLLALGRWKSPRSAPRLATNDPAYVAAVTAVALSTADERLRVAVLPLLSGVAWPTASVILHWCHAAPYPILDSRALWSLGHDHPPPYDFPFWQAYTAHSRALAAAAGVTMRALDRALWQYSWENQ